MDSNKYILFFLVLVLVAAVTIIVLKKDNNDSYVYEGLYGDFIVVPSKLDNLTFYNVHVVSDNQRYILPFRNSPEEVEDIYLEPDIEQKLNKKEGIERLYITKDPDLNNQTEHKASVAVIEFARILGTNSYGIYQISSQSAVTREIDKVTPVVTCANITESIAVILVQKGSENKVYSKDKCIIIEGQDGNGLVMAADRFAYHLMGLM